MKKLILAIICIIIIAAGVSYVAIDKKNISKSSQLENTLTVYTTENTQEMNYIAEEFKKATGITIDYKIVDNLNTALKDKNNNNVDIVYGGNKNEFENMTNEGLLSPTNISFSNYFASEYKNKDGYWYGTSLEPLVMFYNTSYLLPENAPTEWYQLGESTYRDRIVLPETSNFITHSVLGAISYQYEKSQIPSQQLQFLQGLKNNVLAYEANEDDIIKTMKLDKEAAISVGELNEVKAAIDKGDTFNIINPKDGSPMIMQAVGVVKGCKNPNSANLFIEFIAGANMQLKLADKFYAIPTLGNVLPYAPAWMSNYNGLNISNIDWNDVSNNINSVMSTYNALVKNPKDDKVTLEKPVISEPLIESQQKLIDEAKNKKELEKEKSEDKTKQDKDKTKEENDKKKTKNSQAITQSQEQALQGLESFGEMNN